MKYLGIFVFIFANVFMVDIAKCQKADTAVVSYKDVISNYPDFLIRDSTDFIILLPHPNNASEKEVNIKAYYNDGKLRLIGKADVSETDPYKTHKIRLTGECTTYYPDGKIQDVAIYHNGQKDGMEYVYCADGKTFFTKKDISQRFGQYPKELYWDCYGPGGEAICKNGNGHFIFYNEDAKGIRIEGTVKDGLQEGEWKGARVIFDTIKYVYKFEKGKFKSGIGFDKAGVAYPFTEEIELPDYPIGSVNFIRVVRERIKIPKDANGKKIAIDGLHFSFIIEKDGSLSNIRILESEDPALLNSLNEALSKCRKWNPRRFYGVPFRSQIIVPFKIKEGFYGRGYKREIYYAEKILDL